MCASNQNNKAKTLHPDWNLKRSKENMLCLLNFVEKELPIQKNEMSLIGFSYGGQSNLNLLAEKYGHFKRAIFFDSQLEYADDFKSKRFSKTIPIVLEKNENISMPLLFIAGHEASFRVLDSLKYSTRYFVSLNQISHYSFTSQFNVVKILSKYSTLLKEVSICENMCHLVLNFLKINGKNNERNCVKHSNDYDYITCRRMKQGEY